MISLTEAWAVADACTLYEDSFKHFLVLTASWALAGGHGFCARHTTLPCIEEASQICLIQPEGGGVPLSSPVKSASISYA